jgi:hypothetical protein
MTTPTLMDLTNDLAYPVSPSGSSAGAFSDPSIQNTDFRDSEEEGPESGAFRRMTASQILSSTDEELTGQSIEVVSDQNETVFIDGIDESQAVQDHDETQSTQDTDIDSSIEIEDLTQDANDHSDEVSEGDV